MDPSSINPSQPTSFAAILPSNSFTFTANVESDGGTSESSAIVTTSAAPVVSLRTAFNAAAPANHLPTELVIKVLTSGAWKDWWELVALTHICQHWRNVALGTPQLWADAAQSAFNSDRPSWNYQCLPTFVARSGSCPLKVDLQALASLTIDIEDMDDYAVLEPHLSRITHLSAQSLNITEFVQFVGEHGLRIHNIESLHLPYVKRTFLGELLIIDVNKLRFWRNTDFPRLRSLTISTYCFKRHVAVSSLTDLVLHDEPRDYNEFLAALRRCAPGLESLTLHDWSSPEPEWAYRPAPIPSAPSVTIQLPNLNFLQVSLASESGSTAPVAFLFACLSFSADVAIRLDWKCNPGDFRELLPKHVVGLHAPPFFDSLCLHLYAAPYATTMHCYIDGAERLCIRERPLHPCYPEGRSFGDFLDEHRHPTVTQLAVDFDMDPGKGYTLSGHEHGFAGFLRGLPNLRRLDLVGNNIGDAKLEFAKAFLGLSETAHDGSPAQAAGRTLGFVCGKYGDDGRSADADLAQLEQLLKAHQAAGGARLGRLEICAPDPFRETHAVMSRPGYPYVYDVPSSAEKAASLWLRYMLRFRMLVDEVVFVGHVEKRGLGYRVLSSSTAVAEHSTRSRGDKARGTKTGRKPAWKGR
ncbi:hypothetical protein GSI_13379 [Ganoderma sinense ZZ0214-1]|uniref:Uncharacterized protein n=1 Tax=Ganoderma sinense ZZ0214-1 TaxID=1077348 RepID=A0A2G8RVF7_9APHY|nr:hypothetical protein GSI_13379 [Ganoderma sinense ZZ0214-1]